MDDPFVPQVAHSVELKFGAFVDQGTGQQRDVVFLTMAAGGERDSPLTFVLSRDQAVGIARAILDNAGP